MEKFKNAVKRYQTANQLDEIGDVIKNMMTVKYKEMTIKIQVK